MSRPVLNVPVRTTEPVSNTRSTAMLQQLMAEALTRERLQASEERARRTYARKLAVLRRRQRRVDAARRALASLSIY
jgi:hypothetical protein